MFFPQDTAEDSAHQREHKSPAVTACKRGQLHKCHSRNKAKHFQSIRKVSASEVFSPALPELQQKPYPRKKLPPIKGTMRANAFCWPSLRLEFKRHADAAARRQELIIHIMSTFDKDEFGELSVYLDRFVGSLDQFVERLNNSDES
jgi:hypothetical protein